MIYIVGAGPGDPDLITVKGKKKLEEADIIIYAGSLVNDELLKFKKQGAVVYNSAKMNLDEVISVIKEAEAKNYITVRLHTGDPSIYGAIKEQMDKWDELGFNYEIIPGVSSFFAAAAALKAEYTLPGVTQTVIITRNEGRTPVPELERLESLAAHKATMVIFLSISMIDEVMEKLKTHYEIDTPVAVVNKASWSDEKIVTGNIGDIADKVKKAGITKTSLITVGRFLNSEYELSKLYDKHFTHEFREGISE